MPASALASRCHSLSLFGLLQATAAKETTLFVVPEVRIRVHVPDLLTEKARRSEIKVREILAGENLEPKHLVMSVRGYSDAPYQLRFFLTEKGYCHK